MKRHGFNWIEIPIVIIVLWAAIGWLPGLLVKNLSLYFISTWIMSLMFTIYIIKKGTNYFKEKK